MKQEDIGKDIREIGSQYRVITKDDIGKNAVTYEDVGREIHEVFAKNRIITNDDVGKNAGRDVHGRL